MELIKELLQSISLIDLLLIIVLNVKLIKFWMIVTFEKKKPLDEDLQNFILTRIDFNDKTKEINGFCIIHLYFFEEKVYEIIKFDTAHGFCHVHRYYKEDNCLESFGLKKICQESFNEFRDDIKKNWKKYLNLYKNRWIRKIY